MKPRYRTRGISEDDFVIVAAANAHAFLAEVGFPVERVAVVDEQFGHR